MPPSHQSEGHGPRATRDDTIIPVHNEMRMAYEDPQGGDAKVRKEWDRIDHYEKECAVDKSMRNMCINCRKHEGQKGVKLAKCSRCKRVYFCSQKCVHAVSTVYNSNESSAPLSHAQFFRRIQFCTAKQNWKEHTVFCNKISGHSE
jgi:hypothetical protein